MLQRRVLFFFTDETQKGKRMFTLTLLQKDLILLGISLLALVLLHLNRGQEIN